MTNLTTSDVQFTITLTGTVRIEHSVNDFASDVFKSMALSRPIGQVLEFLIRECADLGMGVSAMDMDEVRARELEMEQADDARAREDEAQQWADHPLGRD